MHAPVHKLPVAMPPERSRARRERRCDAARRPVLHVVMPGLEVARETPRKNETITAFLRRTGWAWRDKAYGWQFKRGLPTVLEVNGEPLLRKNWSRRRIAANDNLRFVSYPLGGQQQGGGAKQVIGLVALVAIAAFAGPLGGMAASALGFGGSALATGLATAAIGLGGALLVNSLTAPKPGATNDPSATTDQIYTVQAQGNTAKLGQPLPVRYGREKVYPDFAATPWGEFVGNDQYVNILLSQGMGSFSYEQMFISDTPFWNPVDGVSSAFSSAQIAFYEPGDQVTLFPINVTQSAEVTGQQLPHGTGVTGKDTTAPGAWIGPFVGNPSGTKAYQLAVDFVFPAGCFQADDKGNTQQLTVHLTAERQLVNDAGAPIGNWTTLASDTRTYGSRSPIRDTFLVGVPEGRYQVRFRRDDGVPADSKGASDIVWAGLRAYLRGNNSFPDISTIAIRIKATESTQGSYKFGVVATRKLPVWTGGAFVTQATRNPFWAFLDAVTNSQYGSGHSIAKVDFNAIVNAAAAADFRGDHFDYSFTSASACPDVFDKILTPARTRHFWLGDTVSVVRDEWRDVPSMMLTDREIVRGSTQITWTMLGDDDPDAVIVEYVDESTWLPAQVQYPPNSSAFTATHPEPKRIDGILNRDHAYREAAFYYLQSIYRRENVSIGTEYEGRAITFGSVLRVQSELPMAYGYGGAVLANAGAVLTLDPAPVWVGNSYIRLRRPDGKWFGPVRVARGDSDNIAVLNTADVATAESQQGITLAAVLARADGGEYPSFSIGAGENQDRLCVVLSGQPSGNLCTLNLVLDDVRVHATDLGNPTVLPVGQFPTNNDVPLLVGLTANFDQGIAEPQLRASWFPTAGALYYIADASYDAGNSWINVYEGADNKFEKLVTLGALRLRVQAVSTSIRGPYSAVDLEAPTIEIASGAVALRSLQAGIQYNITQLENANADKLQAITDALASGQSQIAAKLALNKEIGNQQSWDHREAAFDEIFTTRVDVENQISVGDAALGASIDYNQTVAMNSDAALASDITNLFAGVNGNSGQVNVTAQAFSNLNYSYGLFSTDVTGKLGTGFSSANTVSKAISDANTSFASQTSDITAKLGTGFTSINTVSKAIADANSEAGQISTDINAKLGTGFSSANTVQLAIANTAQTAAQSSSDLSAKLGTGFSSTSTVSKAITDNASAFGSRADSIQASIGPSIDAKLGVNTDGTPVYTSTATVKTSITAAANTASSAAQSASDLSAKLGGNFSTTFTVAQAIATGDSTQSSKTDGVSASIGPAIDAKLGTKPDGTAYSSASTVSAAIAGVNNNFANYVTTVTAQNAYGAKATVETNSSAISNLNGLTASTYTLALTVDKYVSGVQAINGGPGLSSFVVMSDKIQFAYPGINGGNPVPFLTTGSVNGQTTIGIRGSMYIDGSINALAIVAGSITADRIGAQQVDTQRLAIRGVAFENLIEGAATARATKEVTIAGPASNAEVKLVVRTGTATVTYSGGVQVASPGVDGFITLYCNGVQKRQWVFRDKIIATCIWDVTGLSEVKEYTFSFSLTSSVGTVDGVGFISAVELRR